MKKVLGLVAVGLAGVAVAVVPALGANVDVNTAPGNTWSPSTVTINVGDTVTFRNLGGTHNLVFDDGAPGVPDGTGWTFPRTFSAPGTYTFRCTLHQPSMTGQVVVNAASSTGTTTTGTTDTTPTTTTPTTTTPTTTAPTSLVARPILEVRRVRSTYCTRKSKRCPRPGITLRFNAGEPLVVTGALERRLRTGYRSDGRVRFSVRAGRSTVRLLRRTNGRRIGIGRYRLRLEGVRSGSPSVSSGAVVVRFVVQR